MENLGGNFPIEPKPVFGRPLTQDLFLFFLDLEVKRARRYQNFLCLMFLKIRKFLPGDDGGSLQACSRTLSNLLMEEIRESDIIGSFQSNRLVVLLPYADVKAGAYVKSRIEDVLKYCDFKDKGFEIMIDQVCFPINGTNTVDLVRKALGGEAT